jgi:hypothetical protein
VGRTLPAGEKLLKRITSLGSCGVIGRQAMDKCVKQLLLKGSRDLWVRDYFRSRFGQSSG